MAATWSRIWIGAAALTLTACGQPQSPAEVETTPAVTAEPAAPDVETAAATVAPRPWFICDAIDQPAIIVAEQADASGAARVTLYSKTGAALAVSQLRLAASEGAAGSSFRNWTRAGQDAGYVRTLNPGVLDEPTDAYTAAVTSVRLGNQDYACRWLARTRFAGFTARRSVFITQDGDGDLLYQTFDFANAATAQHVEIDGAQRSTVFNLEIRDGSEAPEGFAFESNGYRYEITLGADARLRVLQGSRERLAEPFLAYVTGPD